MLFLMSLINSLGIGITRNILWLKNWQLLRRVFLFSLQIVDYLRQVGPFIALLESCI